MFDLHLSDLDLERVAGGGGGKRPVPPAPTQVVTQAAGAAPPRSFATVRGGPAPRPLPGAAQMMARPMSMGGYAGPMMAAPRAGGCASGNCG